MVGGIWTAGDLTLANCTITKNIAQTGVGGGLYILPPSPFSIHNFVSGNTIMAQNQGGKDPDCEGPLASAGSNLIGNNSDRTFTAKSSDQTDTPFSMINALLAPLSSNGGPTQTHALQSNSPAIDKVLTFCPSIDQRGIVRPRDGDNNGTKICDVGAVEF